MPIVKPIVKNSRFPTSYKNPRPIKILEIFVRFRICNVLSIKSIPSLSNGWITLELMLGQKNWWHMQVSSKLRWFQICSRNSHEYCLPSSCLKSRRKILKSIDGFDRICVLLTKMPNSLIKWKPSKIHLNDEWSSGCWLLGSDQFPSRNWLILALPSCNVLDPNVRIITIRNGAEWSLKKKWLFDVWKTSKTWNLF